ncbi:hypothetical protein [Sphingomonas sp.]|uniref:hypothetical protein n=1 Tax=Sphingomonas sp. TaxID=28214 RepID=UPI002C0B4EE2|nr:hypothetical protein [Sphingomonas sp.]HWK35131.1 hypothetical protein [Sphingomonas sp.]
MQSNNPAQRRYIRRFVPAMVGYVVVLFGSTWVERVYHPEGAALFLLSLLPALPLLAVLVVMGLYLAEERDEFIRNRLITAMIAGIGITLAVTTVWGFLEGSEMVPHFPTFLAFPLWCGSFGVVQCALNLRDRMGGGGA